MRITSKLCLDMLLGPNSSSVISSVPDCPAGAEPVTSVIQLPALLLVLRYRVCVTSRLLPTGAEHSGQHDGPAAALSSERGAYHPAVLAALPLHQHERVQPGGDAGPGHLLQQVSPPAWRGAHAAGRGQGLTKIGINGFDRSGVFIMPSV